MGLVIVRLQNCCEKNAQLLETSSLYANCALIVKSPGTQKIADRPTRFHVENFPTKEYIVIPEVSSEKRRYVPMGIMTPDIICSNKLRIMPNVSRYHFGVLQSNVHMAWMRAVAGRLETRYDYSINYRLQ